MENDNKEQLFNGLWIKLQEAMRRRHGGIGFIARSDVENGTTKINNNFLKQNGKVIAKALKDNITEEDDKELTEHLKKVGINIFRYKFIEKYENGVVNEYRFSFEEDKMIVNIRDNNNKLNTMEFEYKDHFKILFNNIIANLIIENEESIFFKKNKYNSSIANTVLKYYFKNTITDFGDFFVPYFEQNCFIVSDALIRISLEIGNINLYNYCLNKSYGTKEKLIRRLPNIAENALISDNYEIIAGFESEFEKNKNISNFLQVACTNKNIGIDLIAYFFNKYEDRYSENNLIKLFGYVYDPRTARMIFHELLAIGFDIYGIDNNIYCSAILCSIAVSGNIEVMQYMLGKLSKILTERQINDIINKSYVKETVLTKAVKYNNIDMVRFLLLRFRININIANKNGKTPLYKAVSDKNIEIVKLLLANDKIDVNIADEYKKTPLHRAVYRGNVEIVKLLLANDKIDVNIVSEDGETPLHEAVYKENIEIVKLLLANDKIDVNIANKNGETPSHQAVLWGNVEIVKLLLANDKIDVNIANKEYRITPLHRAVLWGNVEIVKLLLTNDKIDVNKKCDDGYSPLEYAITKGKKEIVKCLLEGKANYINKNIKNIEDKQKEINKQIEILEDMKNKYTDHKIFIEEAIEEFEIYSNCDEIKKSKCNIF